MIGTAASCVTIAVILAAIVWAAYTEERDELVAHFDRARTRCRECERINMFPHAGGFLLCDDCFDADLDASFWAAVDAGMFDIPLEELSALGDGEAARP